jgi:predicted transcriptional regulator
MKTAVSLPDVLYKRAEDTAEAMGIPRSRLYALALQEYVEKHAAQTVTEKINKALEKISQGEAAPVLNAGLEQWRKLTKDDSW